MKTNSNDIKKGHLKNYRALFVPGGGVIKIIKSFNLDLAVYFGLEFAKDPGLDTVATDDGADELFGGYSFMKDID